MKLEGQSIPTEAVAAYPLLMGRLIVVKGDKASGRLLEKVLDLT
ncbi:MAG: hypothetical protein ACE5D2_05525 [Fidelibacterota bacterium]